MKREPKLPVAKTCDSLVLGIELFNRSRAWMTSGSAEMLAGEKDE
jgi:hypothetical protein